MGCVNSVNGNNKYKLIGDNYQTYDELEQGLRDAGLESCQLIIGVDFTKSNTWNGGMPFYKDKNLHAITDILNPYQQVLSIMCQSLAGFDNDQLIDAFGFGDSTTTNNTVFPFQNTPCYKLERVLECYNIINQNIIMSGPTSFVPIINKAIEIVTTKNEYHILIIIADGEVENINETINIIREASKYPLSIVCIGVGKGPWDNMVKLDDKIKGRKFDNFQFVDFHNMMIKCENAPVEFAKNALMEIPLQYQFIKKNLLYK
jgi:hypothetical protein